MLSSVVVEICSYNSLLVVAEVFEFLYSRASLRVLAVLPAYTVYRGHEDVAGFKFSVGPSGCVQPTTECSAFCF